MTEHLRLAIGQATDPGLARSQNEDALGHHLPDDPAVSAERGALFVVCDGIGGLSSGRVASAFAVDAFTRAYYAAPQASVDRLLAQAARQANLALYDLSRRERGARMGTTLVAAAIRGAALWVLNVGDSRAYLWRGGQLHQVTRDHAPGAGGAARRDRSIDRALGTDASVRADVFGPLPLLDGDCVLLCSDGLTVPVRDAAIARALGDFEPEQAVRQLVEMAKTGGGPDNISVIAVKVAASTGEAAGQAPGEVAGTPAEGAGRAPGGSGRRPAGLSWRAISPFEIIASGRWRARAGALVLAGWCLLVLALALLIGLGLGYLFANR